MKRWDVKRSQERKWYIYHWHDTYIDHWAVAPAPSHCCCTCGEKAPKEMIVARDILRMGEPPSESLEDIMLANGTIVILSKSTYPAHGKKK
jgi:hypothetical protein